MTVLHILLSAGFWERRAIEVIPIVAIAVLIFAIGAIGGFIERIIAKRRKKRGE